MSETWLRETGLRGNSLLPICSPQPHLQRGHGGLRLHGSRLSHRGAALQLLQARIALRRRCLERRHLSGSRRQLRLALRQRLLQRRRHVFLLFQGSVASG